jgi:exopolysaccharide biosynthesis protein
MHVLFVAFAGRTAIAQAGVPGGAPANPITATVAEAAWRIETVAIGVTWRSYHFEHLLGLPQYISVLDIDLATPGVRVDITQADSGRMKTSDIARRSGAIAAVNAGFFEADGTPSLFLQEDGSVIRADDDNRIRFFEDGALATERDGDALVVRRAHAVWRALPDFSDALVAGPMLVWDGEVLEPESAGFNLTHHPRTAVGLTSENHLLLVTADGRNIQAAGLTAAELAMLMQALGCVTALNLDGGGSTTMWIAGEGVVNHPSDNGVFDSEGERAVANAVVVFGKGE